MATKKKTKKSPVKSKKTISKKNTPKKKLRKKKPARKATARKPAPKKAASRKRKSAPKAKAAKKTVAVMKKKVPRKRSDATSEPFLRESPRLRSGEQSGDLQGLSHRESADSDSVDELLGEGNSFEAAVVQGVEDAGDDAEREVRTHEVSEDDVPEEYLDKE